MVNCLWCKEDEDDLCILEDSPYFNDTCPVWQHPEVCINQIDNEEGLYEFAHDEDETC